MSDLMTEERTEQGDDSPRVKLNVDVDPVVREAAGRRAAKLRLERRRRVFVHEVVNEILRRELAEEIAEIEEAQPLSFAEKKARKKS